MGIEVGVFCALEQSIQGLQRAGGKIETTS
jgi:hypothetical protein